MLKSGKLRVFRDKDIEDAAFLVNKAGIKKEEIIKAASEAVRTSPASTEVLRFQKMVDYFLRHVFSGR